MFARTLTMGRISAGKSTFLIKFPPAISEPAASASDDAPVHLRQSGVDEPVFRTRSKFLKEVDGSVQARELAHQHTW